MFRRGNPRVLSCLSVQLNGSPQVLRTFAMTQKDHHRDGSCYVLDDKQRGGVSPPQLVLCFLVWCQLLVAQLPQQGPSFPRPRLFVVQCVPAF